MTLAVSCEMAPLDGRPWSESIEITVAVDIDALLDRLATPPANDAYLDDLRYQDREESPVVQVAVRGEWVYPRWFDDDFDCVPVGDRNSPVAHGGYEPEYFAGTGLPLARAADVVKQWLVNGRRPDAVAWIDADELLASLDSEADDH